MAALASQSDVEASLGRSLTSTEETRVDRLLAGASLLARQIARRPFEAGDYSVGRIVRGNTVRIPEAGTVTEVRAIDCEGVVTTLVADTDYTARGKVIYGLRCYRDVEIDYTATADIPADVVGAVADMVADVYTAPAPADVQSQTAGPFSVSYRTDAGTVVADGVALETLRAYAAPKHGAIVMRP